MAPQRRTITNNRRLRNQTSCDVTEGVARDRAFDRGQNLYAEPLTVQLMQSQLPLQLAFECTVTGRDGDDTQRFRRTNLKLAESRANVTRTAELDLSCRACDCVEVIFHACLAEPSLSLAEPNHAVP